jgi:hypothetical protein
MNLLVMTVSVFAILYPIVYWVYLLIFGEED